jgi:hypothetical protein
MKDTFSNNRVLYGRVIASLILFVLFVIFSVSAQLSGAGQKWPLLLGGLLIGSVLVLPRSARYSRKSDRKLAPQQVEHRARVQRWLTIVRVVYVLVAIFVWLALPELI